MRVRVIYRAVGVVDVGIVVDLDVRRVLHKCADRWLISRRNYREKIQGASSMSSGARRTSRV